MKRILSIVCSLALVFSLMPTAFAVEEMEIVDVQEAVTEEVLEIIEEETEEEIISLLPFSDVFINDWFYEPLVNLYKEKIIVGVSEDTFAPNLMLSKAQVIVMIGRNVAKEDITEDNWNDLIKIFREILIKENIIVDSDYPLKSINEPITRYELADIVAGYLKYTGYNVDQTILDSMSYEEVLNPKYKDDIYFGFVAGMFSGVDSKNTFLGDRNLTRAEGTVVIYRLFNPEARIDDTGFKNYNKLLSTFSTKFDSSITGRSFNIDKSADAISGFVLHSGEEFSFNRVVGNPNRYSGYQIANIIHNGKYVIGYGGGVCQTATTLFNAALKANLKITERHAHSLRSEYVDAGFDATVSFGLLDLKIVNPYDYDIKFVSEVEDGVITFWIYGPNDIVVEDSVIKVEQQNNNFYTLTRRIDGEVNYMSISKYNN